MGMETKYHLGRKEWICIILVASMHVGYVLASLGVLNLITTVLAGFAMIFTMMNALLFISLIGFTSVHPAAGVLHIIGMFSMWALYLNGTSLM